MWVAARIFTTLPRTYNAPRTPNPRGLTQILERHAQREALQVRASETQRSCALTKTRTAHRVPVGGIDQNGSLSQPRNAWAAPATQEPNHADAESVRSFAIDGQMPILHSYMAWTPHIRQPKARPVTGKKDTCITSCPIAQA